TPAVDEIGAALQARQVMSKRVGLAADEEKFRLQEDARGGELHAPIVNGSAAIALLIDDRGGRGAIAQAPVGGHPVERRGCSAAVAIAHLVEPQILGILEEGNEGFAQQRQDAVGSAVGVLYPPCAPGGAFDEAVPLGLVEHGEVLQLGVRLEHAARRVEQPQVFDIAASTVVFAIELRFGGGGGWGRSHGEGGGENSEGGGLG